MKQGKSQSEIFVPQHIFMVWSPNMDIMELASVKSLWTSPVYVSILLCRKKYFLLFLLSCPRLWRDMLPSLPSPIASLLPFISISPWSPFTLSPHAVLLSLYPLLPLFRICFSSPLQLCWSINQLGFNLVTCTPLAISIIVVSSLPIAVQFVKSPLSKGMICWACHISNGDM